MGKIIWLTGNSGAGKSTIAERYQSKHPEVIILDGDELRRSISKGAGFSEKDRHVHNLRVARLAKQLEAQGKIILVTVIAPFKKTRLEINKILQSKLKWIHIYKFNEHINENKPYEEPENPDLIIDTDICDKIKCVEMLEGYIRNVITADICIREKPKGMVYGTNLKEGKDEQ